MPLILRKATMDDRYLLLRWRYQLDDEPWAVPGSALVERDDHELWLARWIWMMGDYGDRVGLFIAMERGFPVGTGRITESPNPHDCRIHYMIDVAHRRKGLGLALVKALVEKATHEMKYTTVQAHIHRENRASLMCAVMGGVNAVGFLK